MNLGVILDPAGRQGAPKSTVLASSRTKISKNDVQNEALEKACVFDGILLGKTQDFECAEPIEMLYIKAFRGL